MAIIYSLTSDVVVNGTGDDDTIVVLGNNDTIFGFGDEDLIIAPGNNNLIWGDSDVTGGPDAGTGNDTLVGGPGDDTLWGGAGADTMTGGGGADTFKFAFVPQARSFPVDTTDFMGHFDLIADFSQAQHDRLDLSGYFEAGERTPMFLGTGEFTSVLVLQLRYEIQGDHTLVQFSAPNPLEPGVPATGEFNLAGAIELTADDVVLVPETLGSGQPPAQAGVNWDALSMRLAEYFSQTGQWGQLEQWLAGNPPDHGPADYFLT